MRLNKGADIDVGQVIDRRGPIGRLAGGLSGWAVGLILSLAGRVGGLRGVVITLILLLVGSLGVHAITYTKSDTVFFSGRTSTGCGEADSGTGPFYCPEDKLVYLDLTFYRELADKLGAPGEFAQPYVLAHEYGHHVQDLVGTEAAMRRAQKRNPDDANKLSVMLELQADCYAGVWAKNATGTNDAEGHKIFESVTDEDIQQGLQTAAAIGDDTLQKEAGKPVDEQGFPHGSSADREKALVWPGITALALVIWVAIWALVTGVVEVADLGRARGRAVHPARHRCGVPGHRVRVVQHRLRDLRAGPVLPGAEGRVHRQPAAQPRGLIRYPTQAGLPGDGRPAFPCAWWLLGLSRIRPDTGYAYRRSMTYHALRAMPHRHRRVPHRRRRFQRPVSPAGLVSVAGVVGSPVLDGDGVRAGTLLDVVVLWTDAVHPPVAGALVRTGHRRTLVPAGSIAQLEPDRVRLSGPLPQVDPQRQPGLVALAHDVLDRQLIDIDGVNVVRVSDLVLAHLPEGVQLVGVDVSLRTLLRRLGPARTRRHVAADRVYDWASVAAFGARTAGEAGSTLRLTAAADELRHLPPTDLDALLADLSRQEREALSGQLREEPTS